MKAHEVKKRLIFVKATPLPERPNSKDRNRRELSAVENTPEFELSEFENIFEFDEELIEIEAARKQFERIEENRLQLEKRRKELGIDEEESFVCLLEEEELPESQESIVNNFFSMEETTELEEDNVVEVVAVLPKLEKKTPEKKEPYTYRNCQFKKENNEECKRQAPHFSPYCKVHRKMMGES